jgi:hypothetical protein
VSSSAAQTLARRVEDAHGGRDAWHGAPAHTVRFSSGGLAFASKGQRRTLSDVDGSFTTGSQRITLHGSRPTPWAFHVESAADLRGKVGRLRRGRRRFRWSIDDIAAFASAAMWTYLSLPFLLTEPDVQLEVVAGTGALERLAVTLPARFTSHATRHVLHIDADGRIRRHDYTAEPISRYAHASQHLAGYERFGALNLATARRVVPRIGGRALERPTLVWIDIHDVDRRGHLRP